MEYMFLLIALFLKRWENYVQGFPRAATHLMLWTGGMFLLVLLLMRVSLCLPRPSIPYISSTFSPFSSISFLLIFERETVALIFVNATFASVNLSVAILEAVTSPEGHLTSKFHLLFFFIFVYFICEDVSLST